MHSKGMYLSLQGRGILVGFLRVWAASSAESMHARDWSNNIRAGEGLAWRRWQIECTLLQVWVRARSTSSVVVVPARCACDSRCSIGDSSRALEISRHAAQQKITPMKCEAAVAIQVSAGLALVSVSRQHARSSLVRFCLYIFVVVCFCNAICCICGVQYKRRVVAVHDGVKSFWLGRKDCSQTL